MKNRIMVFLYTVVFLFALSNCREVKKTDDVSDDMEDVADDVEDGLERAGEEVEGAFDDVKEEVDGETDDN